MIGDLLLNLKGSHSSWMRLDYKSARVLGVREPGKLKSLTLF